MLLFVVTQNNNNTQIEVLITEVLIMRLKFPVISQKVAQKFLKKKSKVAQTKNFFFCLSSFSLMQKYSRTFRKRPPKMRILGGRLCTSQFQNRPSPPRANPGAFDFFEKFW